MVGDIKIKEKMNKHLLDRLREAKGWKKVSYEIKLKFQVY